jgi:hypothetical protein
VILCHIFLVLASALHNKKVGNKKIALPMGPNQMDACSICLQTLELNDGFLTDCLHLFCPAYLEQWVKQQVHSGRSRTRTTNETHHQETLNDSMRECK